MQNFQIDVSSLRSEVSYYCHTSPTSCHNLVVDCCIFSLICLSSELQTLRLVYQRPGAAEQCFGQNIGAQAFRGPGTIIQETGDCEEDHADDGDGDVGDGFSGDNSARYS